MPEIEASAPDEKAAAPVAAPVTESGEQVANSEPDKGGVTPEEVAKVMHLKTPAPAKAAEKTQEKTEEVEAKTADAAKDETAAETAENEDEAAADEAEEEQPAARTAPPVTDDAVDESQFSFTVEDAEGKTFTVTAGTNLDEALKDFTPKSNGQILQILADFNRINADKTQFDAQQAQSAAEAEKAERVSAIRSGWDEEIKQLQADKRLPVTVKDQDNERVAEVFKFMATENDKRIAAGRPTLASFEDALDKLENIEARQARTTADKEAKETSRRNGGLVGGSSAPASGSGPVYRAGTARNANEAIRSLGLE